MEDLYKILQVDPKADPDVIRAAYRALAHKFHPDLNHDASAVDAMKRLNGAYEVLRDVRRRAAYDGQRMTGVGRHDWAASEAEVAHPAGEAFSARPERVFEVRSFSQSRPGKAGLWLGIAAGLLALLVMAPDIDTGGGDLAYQLVTRVWVAIMVFLILWGLIWSMGDLISQVSHIRDESEAQEG